jgi:hypothetical protein
VCRNGIEFYSLATASKQEELVGLANKGHTTATAQTAMPEIALSGILGAILPQLNNLVLCCLKNVTSLKTHL